MLRHWRATLPIGLLSLMLNPGPIAAQNRGGNSGGGRPPAPNQPGYNQPGYNQPGYNRRDYGYGSGTGYVPIPIPYPYPYPDSGGASYNPGPSYIPQPGVYQTPGATIYSTQPPVPSYYGPPGPFVPREPNYYPPPASLVPPVGPSVPAPPGLPTLPAPELVPATTSSVAHMSVRVPANAEIWFEGTKTRQVGTERDFVSPPLRPGSQYLYEIRARWIDAGGKPVEQTQQVRVQAGQRITIDFADGTP